MDKTKIVHPDRDPGFVTGAYSDGVVAGGFLFVSGQAAVDFKTSNIKAIVEASGATMENVVKCTVHLSEISDFDRFNKVYSGYFPGTRPARTTVQSVLAEGIKVEIDCIVKLN